VNKDPNSIMEDHMRETMGLPDWSFREIPWTSDHLFQEFVSVIGDDNIRFMTISSRKQDDLVFTRASALISPDGMENLKQFISQNS
jgi:hypothetical protein